MWKCSQGWHVCAGGIFPTQSSENTLFVGRECLASVGSFTLLLIHCLAHLTTGDFNQDSNPRFLGSFYEVVMIYTELLFLCDSDVISQDIKCCKLCNIWGLLEPPLVTWLTGKRLFLVRLPVIAYGRMQALQEMQASSELWEEHLSWGNTVNA